ncbi:MAG: DUF4476 domain-containing protein [Myxococcota bacterium]
MSVWSWWGVAQSFGALPSIDEPVKTGVSAAADAAVVVGIEDYFVLSDVPYASRDADAFYDFAVYTRGIPSDRVTLLTGPVSREKLVSALGAAGKSTRSGGTVFVYFAGHGAASPATGERLLIGADAQADLETFEARAVSIAEVERLATAGGGSAVLVLDTCYSGKSRTGGDVVPGKRFAVPSAAAAPVPRVVEWTAAGPDQWSGPLDAARHGAFTYLAVGALRGWADGQRDGKRDGVVTLEEAGLYVEAGLQTLQIRDQRPARTGDAATVLSRGSEAAPALAPQAGAPAPAAGFGTGPGQLQIASRAAVVMLLDGVMVTPDPNTPGVLFVDGVSPGAHQLEVRSAFGKAIVSKAVEVPPGTQVRLQYQDKALTELGRGPNGAKPAPVVLPSSVAPPVPLPSAGAAPGRDAIGAHLAAMEQLAMWEDRVQYLRNVHQPLTCAEVAQLLGPIELSENRIAAVRLLAPSVVDPQNVGQILAVLTFEDEKRQVREMF